MELVADRLADAAFHLSLVAEPVAVRNALALIAASGPVSALSADHRARVEIVLAEVLNNTAEHAYAGAWGMISVNLKAATTGLACQVIDRGREMPGGTLPLGHLPQEDYPEGGFGWHLIRSLTLDLHYDRANGQNRLRFVIPA